MAYKYATTNYNKDHMAKAVGTSLPISLKSSVEICNHIRNKPLERVKRILEDAKNKKKAIPFRRFTNGAGHQPGVGAAKYPIKACTEILGLLEAVEANAQFKGLSTGSLFLTHICAQGASRPWRPGRKRRRKMKRTHIEVVVEERVTDSKIKTKTAIETEKKVEGKKEISKDEKPKGPKKIETKAENAPKEEKKAEPKKEVTKEKSKETEKKPNPAKKVEDKK